MGALGDASAADSGLPCSWWPLEVPSSAPRSTVFTSSFSFSKVRAARSSAASGPRETSVQLWLRYHRCCPPPQVWRSVSSPRPLATGNMLILPGVPRTPFTVLEGGKQLPPSSVPRSQCGHRPSAADHPPTFSSLRGAFSFIGTISSHWLHQFGRWRLRFGISHLLHLLSQSKLSFSHSVTFLITCLSQRKVIRISEVMNVENRSLSRVS